MSSVFGVLSRTDRPTDGSSPSAEAAFFAESHDVRPAEPLPSFEEMLTFVGGSWAWIVGDDTDHQFLYQVLLSPRATQRLRPWSARTIYAGVDDVPQQFCDDVAALYLAMRDSHDHPPRRTPCKACGQGQASEALMGVARQVCRPCKAELGAIDSLQSVKALPCPDCGADTFHGPKLAEQKEVAGTRYCEPCYRSHNNTRPEKHSAVFEVRQPLRPTGPPTHPAFARSQA